MTDQLITAEIILRGLDGSSIIELTAPPDEAQMTAARPTDEVRRKVCDQLRESGFEISTQGEYSLSVTGSRQLFEVFFQASIEPAEASGSGGSFSRFTTAPTVPPDLDRTVAAVELAPPHELHP